MKQHQKDAIKALSDAISDFMDSEGAELKVDPKDISDVIEALEVANVQLHELKNENAELQKAVKSFESMRMATIKLWA